MEQRCGLLYVVTIWSLVGIGRADGLTPDVGSGEPLSLCGGEIFEPICDVTQVVFVKEAWYGRMRVGRCVEEDFGYGCERNVLSVFDGRCSGHRKCVVDIQDREFYPIQPCHNDLKSYLEITYTCLDVFTPEKPCNGPVHITESDGYIASIVTTETGCGTSESPFVLEALPGQRFNITLFDFAVGANASQMVTRRKRTSNNLCKVYATLKETEGSGSVTICGEEGREKTAYLSKKNTIEIRVYGKGYFLLHYKVIGCPDPERPSGGWVERNEQTALLGCDENKQVWQWVCSGTVWTGPQKNCTPAQLVTLDENESSGGPIPMGVSIVIVVILALVVGAVILIIGLVCLKKPHNEEDQQNRRKGDASSIPLQDVPGDVIGDDKHTVVCAVRNTHTTTVIHRLKEEQALEGSPENDYATTKLLTSSGNDMGDQDYGDYIRRAKTLQDPYYMSRLECCHGGGIQDDGPPDVTQQGLSDQGCAYQKYGPDRNLYDINKDAIIVDLGPNHEPEVLQIHGQRFDFEHPCACVHNYDRSNDHSLCNSPDYIYHQGACCRMCGGHLIEAPVSRELKSNPGTTHTLGHHIHSKDTSDPNCVICSLPRNQPAKPNS